MSHYFTAKEVGFYDSNIKDAYDRAGTWPGDALEISDAEHALYSGQPPSGKMLGSENGRPAWVDMPPLTAEELAATTELKKASLRAVADSAIAPLQDAVELGIATEEETETYNQWRKYRVLLSRVDISTAPDIRWPDTPQAK